MKFPPLETLPKKLSNPRFIVRYRLREGQRVLRVETLAGKLPKLTGSRFGNIYLFSSQADSTVHIMSASCVQDVLEERQDYTNLCRMAQDSLRARSRDACDGRPDDTEGRRSNDQRRGGDTMSLQCDGCNSCEARRLIAVFRDGDAKHGNYCAKCHDGFMSYDIDATWPGETLSNPMVRLYLQDSELGRLSSCADLQCTTCYPRKATG